MKRFKELLSALIGEARRRWRPVVSLFVGDAGFYGHGAVGRKQDLSSTTLRGGRDAASVGGVPRAGALARVVD